MEYLLQTLELIYKKYRALIVPFYGIIGLLFMWTALYLMWTVYSYIKQIEARNYVIDAGFLIRQVEKIQRDVKDFKLSDVPYANMICDSYTEDYYIQRHCQIINKFLESKGW